jgi:hypothetical protein
LVSLSEFLEKLELNPFIPRQTVNENSDVSRLVISAMIPHRATHQQAMKARRLEFWRVRPVSLLTLIRISVILTKHHAICSGR